MSEDLYREAVEALSRLTDDEVNKAYAEAQKRGIASTTSSLKVASSTTCNAVGPNVTVAPLDAYPPPNCPPPPVKN